NRSHEKGRVETSNPRRDLSRSPAVAEKKNSLRPLTFRVGSATCSVDSTPLAMSSMSACNKRLVQRADCLVIKPNLQGRLVLLFWLLLMAAFLSAAVCAIRYWPREPVVVWWLATVLWSLGIL